MCSRDITERIEGERQRLNYEIEKNEELRRIMEMKDEFLSLISHEFKTPIAVIVSAIQAIVNIHGDKLPKRVMTLIQRIKQNTYRQLRLVNNLLDISRANAGQLKTNKTNMDIIFLTKSIVESVSEYAMQKDLKLIFLSDVTHKVIGVDEEKYERILLNLLSNAIKFTPPGKSIEVIILDNDDKICIKIRDEGIGIPIEKQALVFERFGQVDSSLSKQAEGSGLGLTIVKLLVEALSGSIQLHSIEGEGTTFTIQLPGNYVCESEEKQFEAIDSRLVQAISIELSDIYY